MARKVYRHPPFAYVPPSRDIRRRELQAPINVGGGRLLTVLNQAKT